MLEPKTNFHEQIIILKDGIEVLAEIVIACTQTYGNEESLVRAEVNQVLGGHPVVQEKKYKQCAERVKRVVDSYPARRQDMLGYLRAIAYNLSF